MSSRVRAASVSFAAVLLLAPLAARALETNCSDGLDDDGDFLTDCADDDCATDVACRVSATRSFDVVRDDPSNPATSWFNYYLVSWPEVPDIGDLADSSYASSDKCVGHPRGPLVGDGLIDSTDALCLIWDGSTHSSGDSLAFARYDEAACRYQAQSVTLGFAGLAFTPPFPIDRVTGYLVSVGSTRTPPPTFPTVLAGWNDRSWPGKSIELPSPFCRPALILLHLPFDMLEASADEILCGLAGVDFATDANGDPMTCPRGIFDGATPISVQTYDNDPSTAPTFDLRSNNWPVSRTALMTDRGLEFLGVNFRIHPGDAILVQLRDDQQPRQFQPYRP